MLQRFIGMAIIFGVVGPVVASDSLPLPKGVPPIIGTAVVTNAPDAGEFSEWRIGLTVPKIRWEVVGELIPKKSWPEVKVEVEKVILTLRMGGPSQLAESRVLDVKGKELTRDQVITRLAKETPVLVSVSGAMPDAYFLQLTNTDAIVVILGPRDGFPAPQLLPAKRESATKVPERGK